MKRKKISDRFFEEYFWSRVKIGRKNECWPWLKSTSSGYGACRISDGRGGSHRISYELCNGYNPGRKHVLHECDNRICCNPYHLFLGTHKDNRKDCVDKERHARGELNGGAKLLGKEVIIIYQTYWGGIKSIKELALEFNVSMKAIKSIVYNITWRHLKLTTNKDKTLICNKCKREFSKPRSLNTHKTTWHERNSI